MAKAKQITVWVESRPGELGRIARALGAAKVNLTGFVCYGFAGESPVRLQVSSPAKARQVLQGLGLRVTEEEVLRLTLPDKPGALAEVARRLGEADVNLEYGYGSIAKGGKKVDVVLGVSDLAAAAQALRGL